MAQMRSHEDEAFLLVRLAELAVRRGDPARAREIMTRARAGAEAGGSTIESVYTLSMLGEIERHAGDLGRARELHDEAMRRLSALPPAHPAQAHARAMVLALSARLAAGDGGAARAHPLICEAYRFARATNDLPIVAAVAVVVADLAAAAGRDEAAAEVLGAAARLRGGDDLTSPDIARLHAELGARLGTGFAARYGHGRALDRVTAVDRVDPAAVLAGTVPAGTLPAGTVPAGTVPAGQTRRRVGAQRQRDEHRQQRQHPHHRPEQVRLHRAADHQAADHADQVGDRVDLDERLQPAGHRGGRDERRLRRTRAGR